MAAPVLEAGANAVSQVDAPRANQMTVSPAAAAISALAADEALALAGVEAASVAGRMEANPAWPMISRLSVTLAARIPMAAFRVRDLLALAAGQTIATTWVATEDVPLLAGDLQVGWSEFEVVGRKMALRLTRLV
jgi:flagellar motor switch/type III secretory pathway protein FliN